VFFFPNVHKAFLLGLSTCHYGLGDPSHGNLISVTTVGFITLRGTFCIKMLMLSLGLRFACKIAALSKISREV